MILVPTNVTINGKRAWLQGDAETEAQKKELEAALDCVDYQTKHGIGVHMQYDAKLPKAERIVTDAPTARR